MNGNAELLNFIYQNSQMGVNILSQLMDIAEDEEFRKHLQQQYEEYKDIHEKAKQALNENGYDEKGISALDKIKTYIMVNIQTLTDKSSSHIAEMLMVGSNMGIINAIKNLKKYSDAEQSIKSLMERLLKLEENNVQQLKNFL
jgi:FtsZ-interacting cell division protein YlmF